MKLKIQLFGGRGARSSITNKKTIHTYSTDAYSGQVNMVKEIRDKNDKVIAKLQYTDYENKAYIDLIETKEEYRRQGYATQLINDLEKEYGDNIDWGYTTPDGTKFKQAYDKKKLKKNKKRKMLTEEEFIKLFKSK